MPFSCAASSASAICRAMRQRLGEWDRPLRDALGERVALDELEDERGRPVQLLEAVDGADVRMIQGGQ